MIRILSCDDHPLFGREWLPSDHSTGHDPGRGSLERARCDSAGSSAPPVHHLHDLQMPEMNGLDAMITIRREFPEARTIILTTFGGDVKDAMKLGARAFSAKASLNEDEALTGSSRCRFG
jgi:ActR/RegA family two-component response regulator